MPKSVTRGTPEADSRMLAGVMSPCISPLVCACAMPARIWLMAMTTRAIGMAPSAFSNWLRVRPSTYSNTT